MIGFLCRYLDSVLLILGLVVSLVGAAWAAWAVVIDESTADKLSATMWGQNPELKKSLLKQSRAARNGLVLVAIGSIIQIVGVFVAANK
jgi:hypothetical protein